jgi:type IV pilus assembly protein PilX
MTPRPMRANCRGAGLVVALVVLVVMSLGALALVRAVASGLLVAGNFAFREAAVLAAESGSESAISWLSERAATTDLLSDQPEAGYYASLPVGLSLSGQSNTSTSATIDWDDDQCAARTGIRCFTAGPALPIDAAGHRVRYVIHRLCRTAGSSDAAANSCLLFRSAQGGSSNRGQLSYGASKRFQSSDTVYYRITVHVRGPRNTTAFVQTLVHY